MACMACDTSTFVVDDPLPDGACWFRVITNKGHITKDQTLNATALQRQFGAPDDPAKAWSHELSGVARCFFSTAKEARDYCEAFVQSIREKRQAEGKQVFSYLQFEGVAYCPADKLRLRAGNARTDTAYTPDDRDQAHADFVTFGTTDAPSLKLIEAQLLNRIRVLRPAELDELIHA
jgi:hypothetical protein